MECLKSDANEDLLVEWKISHCFKEKCFGLIWKGFSSSHHSSYGKLIMERLGKMDVQ